MLGVKTVVVFFFVALSFIAFAAAFQFKKGVGALVPCPQRMPFHAKTLSPKQTRLLATPTDQKNEDGSDFWAGEWVCADCGYIYDKDVDGGGLYFEQLPRGFICPQCSAPRKRYAKKVGDKWGVTRDGGDIPIYAFTVIGLALTVWFALVYVPTL